MSRFLFRQRTGLAECARQLNVAGCTPVLCLQGLQTGIDNVRKDVFLSPKFCEVTHAHIVKLIASHGSIEDLLSVSPHPTAVGLSGAGNPRQKRSADAQAFKSTLSELQTAALSRAKTAGNISLDLLGRLAVVKFLRAEMMSQFNLVLEQCRAKLGTYDGPRQSAGTTAIELRERVAAFQVGKKDILRKVGQELLQTLREVERESLHRTRRSLFGEGSDAGYELLDNRLLFTENGRDDVMNAEHYVMLGNFDQDPDRFGVVVNVTGKWLEQAGLITDAAAQAEAVAGILCCPANAQELTAGGNPDTATPKGIAQKALLEAWAELLDKEGVLDAVIASYEGATLLAEYSPPLNPQQLKQALIWREERQRVEQLLEQHGKKSPENFHAAIKRVARCRGVERDKVAGRFLRDFMRYYRDLRGFEVANAALDGINLISTEKLRELSAINRTLYEFLLAEEQKPAEAAIIHHIVLKADVRDSSVLTRSLFDRGLNPASYFSLNFYEPVNKLLPKYGATKLFIEGDAIILALFERQGESETGVARACILAREIIEIVRAYNQKSRQAGLPSLELGIGICYQDSAPMYLVDGTHQIMISPALNESDRLSSCSRSARRTLKAVDTPFNVFYFQPMRDGDEAEQNDEFLMRYNVGGINLSEGAFNKLRSEIALELHETSLTAFGESSPVRLFSGTVRLGPGMFHNLVVREANMPEIDARDFSVKGWTERRYYEVCTSEAVYESLAQRASKATAED